MKQYTLTRSTGFDAEELDKLVRDADRREFEEMTALPFVKMVKIGILMSDKVFTLRHIDGTLGGILGVSPIADRVGIVWMACTDTIEKRPTVFLRNSKEVLEVLMEGYDMIHNVVDERNTVHMKWLKWLGFDFIRKTTHGPKQVPVWEFAKLNV